jgi:hypothetical protein
MPGLNRGPASAEHRCAQHRVRNTRYFFRRRRSPIVS